MNVQIAMSRGVLLLQAVLALVSSSATTPNMAYAVVYHVGPNEKTSKIASVAGQLEPGDVVEVTGNITESFELTKHGTREKPITLRGLTRIENRTILRPRLTVTNKSTVGIYCKGDWNIIEGLDITGAKGDSKLASTAVYTECKDLVIRNCRFHHNGIGVYGSYTNSGNITVEFCEFDSNGGTYGGRSLYLNSLAAGSTATVQFCYLHDGTDGFMLKSCYPRNVIRYNWFENPFSSAITIISNERTHSPDVPSATADAWYPGHSDIVGNVFIQGHSPGPRWAVLSLGGEADVTEGTEGTFSIAHNLFVTTNNGAEAPPVLLVHGNVERLRACNNVILPVGTRGATVCQRGIVWNTPRTEAFIKRRANGEPILDGSNNWVAETAAVVRSFPQGIRGVNPSFVDLLNGDYRPRQDSPLRGAGLWPLPPGQIVDLAPEYEPQRGIPVNLEPIPRRKVVPPSIGPFEAVGR